MVRLTDRPDMTLDVYRGRKTTIQPTNQIKEISTHEGKNLLQEEQILYFMSWHALRRGL